MNWQAFLDMAATMTLGGILAALGVWVGSRYARHHHRLSRRHEALRRAVQNLLLHPRTDSAQKAVRAALYRHDPPEDKAKEAEA